MPNKRSAELKISVLLFAIAAICFSVHFLFFRDSFPPVNVDEASFFSPANSFVRHGKLSSDVHQSFLPGSAMYTYWMPPLYLVLLGAFLKIAGVTVFNAKFLSFILTCFSAFLISKISSDRYIKLSLSALVLICPFIIITSAFIRVEALAILLIVISILAVRFEANQYLIGIIAGLGIMTHPLMMPCCAGLALVMLRRGIKPFIIFSLMVLITISPYIFYIFKDVEVFKEQMALQFLRKSKARFSDLTFSYIFQSVPMALAALFCVYKINKAKELKLFLATAILLSLFIILKSNEFNYQVYLVPYVVASIGILMYEKKENVGYRNVLPFVMYSFFAVLLVFKIVKYHFRNDDEYKQTISYLGNNRNWSGKDIYVIGNPDITTYLIMHDQHVEKPIPIAIKRNSDWFKKYNYVVEIKDNYAEPAVISGADSVNERPWITWQKKTSFTTSKGSITMNIFLR